MTAYETRAATEDERDRLALVRSRHPGWAPTAKNIRDGVNIAPAGDRSYYHPFDKQADIEPFDVQADWDERS